MSEPLTVLIPCKNERLNLRLCVESVRALADEILVADSGSTDGSREIAEELGCRVIEREYENGASFKNWAIPQAAHSWVLIVDADERVTPELAAEIRRVLKNPPPSVDGYWIGFHCYFMGHALRFAGWNTPALRLLRRDVCRYAPRLVHEEVRISRKKSRKLKHKLLHYSYWNVEQYLAKYERYTTLSAKEYWNHGRRATFWSLAMRPWFRFLYLYFFRLGLLDGLPGLQSCMLAAFFNTFIKQAKLWQMECALQQPNPEGERGHNEVPIAGTIGQASKTRNIKAAQFFL